MKNNYCIIREDEFQKSAKLPEGSAEIINKYKDQLIEINIYVINEGEGVHLRPPLTKDSVKSYYILEGKIYCITTKEYYKKDTLVMLRYEDDLLHINALERTCLLVHSVRDDSYIHTENSFIDIYNILLKIQNKDAYTHNHSMRVYELAKMMATNLGYQGQRFQNLCCAAKYHDIGKIYVDDEILNKPSQLTEAEYEAMKEHVTNGKNLILENFNIETYEIIKQHHERTNGSGYPKGLKGEEILEEAKIIAICDTFDAMTTDRVYKKGKSKEDALKLLKEQAGLQYDKALVQLFFKIINE
ncbi:HD-GYP domain-containing protein [Alkaliphilus transvaalensis]|uniref:HD-GYP domain-containing protein n=1 Tax=Alkaliphilus transvaalensis TaxID=114628 RepID=UPI00068411EE|nr:HD-GYP domain-containing protein [Alkaliphilus transvaalensis]